MDAADCKGQTRRLEVKPANLRHNHIYVRAHMDFFPPDVVGGSGHKSKRMDQS